jgi:hypothetical protein
LPALFALPMPAPVPVPGPCCNWDWPLGPTCCDSASKGRFCPGTVDEIEGAVCAGCAVCAGSIGCCAVKGPLPADMVGSGTRAMRKPRVSVWIRRDTRKRGKRDSVGADRSQRAGSSGGVGVNACHWTNLKWTSSVCKDGYWMPVVWLPVCKWSFKGNSWSRKT